MAQVAKERLDEMQYPEQGIRRALLEYRASDEKDEMDIYRKLQYYELFDHGTVN